MSSGGYGTGAAEGALAGARSDIPAPRARTPSPIRGLNKPAVHLARDFNISPDQVDVIYAEDEEVFRETAIRELIKAGFVRHNIYEADNGLGALEHLARMQDEGNLTMPLVVLLDVRMPGMDGRECALQIQELVKKKLLRREPFVVCISSISRKVEMDEGGGNFQIVLPKPITVAFLEDAFELLKKWWTMGFGRQLAAWKEFNPDNIDIISADDEPVCRMSSSMAFVSAGVLEESIVDADDDEELLSELENAQAGDINRPLIILLGNEAWVNQVRTLVEEKRASQILRREPFVVCTSVNSDRLGASTAAEHFHAFLPRTFTPKDVKWCLEYCKIWWLTRSAGPYAKCEVADANELLEEDSEPEQLSDSDGD
eukprot:TRINITY_DN5505_c0_g1_i3.p1 TRINITY_DN5505_c0_g1~~TRINITY_DN5505_c0_g1_i3.p1  ORF type:complete len:371 (-),score=71.21 TRINITY_DN5505_c0_g1_i3:42-1154(-)